MSALLPQRSPVEPTNRESQVVNLGEAGSDAVFSVLSTEIARQLLAELYEDPATQSELADRLDTSLQNVNYHLGNLVEAGLVEVVDQWYSEKGREMDVYAPDGSPLVLVVGGADDIKDGGAEPTRTSPEPTPRAGE